MEQSPSFEAPMHSTPVIFDVNLCCDAEDAPVRLSDADLYHHYIQHTSRTITYCQKDQIAMQVGIPTLALRNKTVFHSLLALSAACLGCDMISKYPPPDVSAVNQVLMSGYRHYNLASEQLREMISQLDDLRVEPVLASNILLVPFAAASQQINHWISSRRGTRKSRKLLSSTPMDVIVIMRGIRTMLQAVDCCDSSPDLAIPEDPEFAIDGASSLEFDIPSAVPGTSHTHVMFPILAATSQEAFAQLQERLDSAERNASYARHPDDPLSACVAAFDELDDIRIGTFSSSNPPALASPTNKARKPFEPKQAWLPRVAPWLRDYASRPAIPSPTEPLTRAFLSFLVQVPQSYLDLVMPLLEQRLETTSVTSPDDAPIQLATEQALALDIYAYWSVLMFLVEEESWWIGTLPVVTLTGMINRYGDEFVAGLRPQVHGHERWWPGIMLTVLREIKRGSIC